VPLPSQNNPWEYLYYITN